MVLTTQLVNLFFSRRRAEIDHFRKHPTEVQQKQLDYLLKKGRHTLFGQMHDFASIRTPEEFARQVEVQDYEMFRELILRTKQGEQQLFWPSRIEWFAKSSGTTGSKSKYIPVSREGLQDAHLQGPRDVIALFAALYPDTNVFSGKTLTLGGSCRIEQEGDKARSGDLSAILIRNTPVWADLRRTPSADTALIPDFELKVQKICKEAIPENVTSFAGVPSWNLVMMNKILEYTGKENLLEVWPHLELFVHGGMSFKPYQEVYRQLIPSSRMKYMETYNASEGFFAIADDPTRDDMLLMLDYHIYYEFLPMASLNDPTKAVPLEGVRPGVNYAMIISTSNGLWRYLLGDTVEFTSIAPYRIRITGRTKHFINVFGEEVMVENAESALRRACDLTGAEVAEFTVAPVFMEGRSQGAHEWVIEFRNQPTSQTAFAEALDKALQEVNSDYEAKRFKNTTLLAPHLSIVPTGTFLRWMEQRGKLGGQHKVPRLYNDRTFVEELLAISAQSPQETTGKP